MIVAFGMFSPFDTFPSHLFEQIVFYVCYIKVVHDRLKITINIIIMWPWEDEEWVIYGVPEWMDNFFILCAIARVDKITIYHRLQMIVVDGILWMKKKLLNFVFVEIYIYSIWLLPNNSLNSLLLFRCQWLIFLNCGYNYCANHSTSFND